MEEERAWIEQALRGDRAAFGQLVRAYERPVYNLTYRMLGNPPEAEDAAQETFLRAYSKLATYQPGRKFVNWLLSIASHHWVKPKRVPVYSTNRFDSLRYGRAFDFAGVGAKFGI